ncbi:MAG: YggS family pyridoxal phosphate-dependent enzyme [Chloracidobacterium sp.]|nr:YggS family pyridoxal phosphate-dependent enzyme [Chloracidobacterium sp.]
MFKTVRSLRANLTKIQKRIAAAAERAERDPGGITLVAVTKTHPASVIKAAIKAGITTFGENKVQEAEAKISEVGRDKAEWHLIGHLQKNKARKAAVLFDVIHSLDSPELAHRLERMCEEEGRETLSVLVQVDLAGEKTKSGIVETQLPLLVEVLKRCSRLRFDGLMVMPPLFEDPEETRPYFVRLRNIRDRLRDEGAFSGGAGHLSMGMSHDLEVAVEEGSTIVRVGTAIFGGRS